MPRCAHGGHLVLDGNTPSLRTSPCARRMDSDSRVELTSVNGCTPKNGSTALRMLLMPAMRMDRRAAVVEQRDAGGGWRPRRERSRAIVSHVVGATHGGEGEVTARVLLVVAATMGGGRLGSSTVEAAEAGDRSCHARSRAAQRPTSSVHDFEGALGEARHALDEGDAPVLNLRHFALPY